MIKYVCLPSGGVKLIAYLGVLNKLIETDHLNLKNIKGYYGISAGSVLSAILCLGFDFKEIINYFIERTWHKIFNVDQINFFNYFNDKGIINKTLFGKLFEHLFKAKGMDINTLTMSEFYEKTNVKLCVFAVNACNFQLKQFNYETTPDILVLDALYYSSCIPTLFKPYEYEGVCYLDGGMHTNTPVDICVKQENIKQDEVLVLEVLRSDTLDKRISVDDTYFNYIIKILGKLHVNGTPEISADEYEYLIKIPTLDDYIYDYHEITTSPEARNAIYLKGIEVCESYLEAKQKQSNENNKNKETNIA